MSFCLVILLVHACLCAALSVSQQLQELQRKLEQKQEEVTLYRDKYEDMSKRVSTDRLLHVKTLCAS